MYEVRSDVVSETCERLAFRVDPMYKFFKLAECFYTASENKLEIVLLYDADINNKIDMLKSRLEREIKDAVSDKLGDLAKGLSFLFEYKKVFIDAQLLQLKVAGFLRRAFSVLTLDLDDEDIKIMQTPQGYTVNLFLPQSNIDYISKSNAYREFLETLHDEHFVSFEVFFNARGESDDEETLSKLENYMQSVVPPDKEPAQKIDKSLKIYEREYLLGKPIKERPIKIEFLRLIADEQIIAGTIGSLTQREYTPKNNEEKKPYYTFTLDDGRSRVSCIFFPTIKSAPKFKMLSNASTICAIGIYSDRGRGPGFRVTGISFCELK